MRSPSCTCAGPSEVTKWQCYYCGHVHDEAVGDPEGGVAPDMRFADIPDSWKCPVCGADKSDFFQLAD
jgi:rubredoxin